MVNPVAGSGRVGGVVDDLLRELRARGMRVVLSPCPTPVEASPRPTSSPGSELAVPARQPWSDAGCVVAVGGDGTVRDVVTTLTGRAGPVLAVLPAGSENVFARAHGFPPDPAVLAGLISRGRSRPVDVMVARALPTGGPDAARDVRFAGSGGAEAAGTVIRPGERPVLCVAGVGLDAEILRRLPPRRGGRSRLDYLPAMWRAALEFRPPPIRVVLDGATVADAAGVVSVAKVPRYAFGLRVVPHARDDDGRLHALAADCGGPVELARVAVETLLRPGMSRPGRRPMSGHDLRVLAPAGVPWHLDGDVAGAGPVGFRVLPAALRVLDTR